MLNRRDAEDTEEEIEENYEESLRSPRSLRLRIPGKELEEMSCCAPVYLTPVSALTRLATPLSMHG